MKRIITSLILIAGFIVQGNAQVLLNQCESSTPCNARVICGNTVNSNFSFTTAPAFNPMVTCASSTGTFAYASNWVYYRFTCYTTGTLNFRLNSNDSLSVASDLDWALWDISTTGCGSLTSIVECNAAGNGATGILTGGLPAANFEPNVTITAGNTYIIGISNRDGVNTGGFTLNFNGSTASINDTKKPYLLAVAPFGPCSPLSFVKIRLSEPVRCDQVGPAATSVGGADLNISGLATTAFTVTPLNCSGCTNPAPNNSPSFFGNATDSIKIDFGGNLAPGTYTVTPIANQFFDLCGKSDSTTATLVFTVPAPTSNSSSVTTCNTYVWNGITYTTSGTLIHTYVNAASCDSVHTLQLTINYSTFSNLTVSSINSYTWPASGLTYTSSGTYSYTTVNVAGCDSIMSLNLTIYQSAVNMTLQNVVQISPSVFEYDIMLTNTGNTALALKGYSCGINHAVGMRNGGTLTHTFVSRDPSLAAIPNPVAGYTSSSNHLRITAANTTNGNEINLSPALPVRIATMRVSNSVPFPADFIPSLALQTLTAVGKTACITNCIVTPPGSVYTINGVGNTPATGFIQGLTGVVNTPCLYLNKTANFAASMSQSSPVSCYGQGNGVAQISSSGTGSSSTGMYSINGGAMTAYASIPFSISNLAAATYTVALTSSNGCVTSSISTISQPSLPTIVTTAAACNSYTWQGVTYTASGSATNTFISATGCDSIHTKNFLINYSDASSSSFAACGSYSWNGISYTTSGTYIQTYTNSTGCDSTLTLNLTVNPIPSPSISASAPLTFCDGMSIALNANIGAGLTYQWKKNGTTIFGATSNSYTASQSGSYTVEETNSSNCSAASSPQVVTVNNCNVSLQLKLFIQGYYDQASTMLPVLLNQLASTDNTLTDTILVELHNALYPFNLALSKKAVLHTNGSAVCTFNYVNGNYYLGNLYYVAIRHRNGLLTWSANPIAFDSTTVVYDFSSSSSKAYGDNMLEVEPGVWAMYSADLNQDQNVDLLDMPILEADIAEYMFGYAATDLNGDGNTDLLDVIYMDYGIANYLFSMYPVSATLPTVSTNAIDNITYTTASSGGSISSNGGAAITARGVCWSISPNPTVSLSTKTIDGIGSGSFTSSIAGLVAGTTYYVRAYATNSVGTAYGNQVVFTAPLAIGQYYQGGIVAYILQPGDPGYDANVLHGLIAAPSDQSMAAWGCVGTSISGADGTAIGTGNQNTVDIMNGCATAGIAARLCGDLVLNGYSDWYLPSKNELNKLYLNKTAIGGFAAAYYWSSSESNYSTAWFQGFSYGSQSLNGKNVTYYVRAVRAF